MIKLPLLYLGWAVVLMMGAKTVPAQDLTELVDQEEMTEVLQAMAEAGQAPSAHEQSAWLAAIGPPLLSPAGSIFSRWQGQVRFRGSCLGPGLEKGDVRVDLSAGPVRARFRYGRDTAGSRLMAGALEARGNAHKAVVGHLGMESGCGLMLARPGRGASLAADATIGRSRPRLVPWSSAPDARTVLGTAVEWRPGHLVLQGMVGRLCLNPDQSLGSVRALSLSLALRSSLLLGFSGMSVGAAKGLSLWGQKEKGTLEFSGEAVAWLAAPDRKQTHRWQAMVSVRPRKNWGIQGGLAHAAGNAGSPLGMRSPLLRGEEGDGWAIRGYCRPRSGMNIALLGAESRQRTSLPRTQKELTRSWDFIVGGKAGENFRIDLRIREKLNKRWQWSDRYRWQPAATIILPGQRIVQLGLAWNEKNQALKVTGKWLGTAPLDQPSHRVKVGLAGRWDLGPAWRLRAAYGSSWGQPLDLVGAASPLPGLVLPRHWGSWRSETLLGLGWRGQSLEIWSAASLRQPGPEVAKAPNLQAWLEVRLAW